VSSFKDIWNRASNYSDIHFISANTNVFFLSFFCSFPPLRPPREKQVGTGNDEDGENIEALSEKFATVALDDIEDPVFSSSVDKEDMKERKDFGTPV